MFVQNDVPCKTVGGKTRDATTGSPIAPVFPRDKPVTAQPKLVVTHKFVEESLVETDQSWWRRQKAQLALELGAMRHEPSNVALEKRKFFE